MANPEDVLKRCDTYDDAKLHLVTIWPTMANAEVDTLWSEEEQRRALEDAELEHCLEDSPFAKKWRTREWMADTLKKAIGALGDALVQKNECLTVIDAAIERLQDGKADEAMSLLTRAQRQVLANAEEARSVQ